MEEDKVIGISLGPGEKEDTCKIVTDKIDLLQTGEYVYYVNENDQKVICRVSKRKPINPQDKIVERINNFLSEDMLESIIEESEGYIVNLNSLGVYFEEYGEFRNLREPPKKGQKVYYCSNDFLSSLFTSNSQKGILKIGTLLNRKDPVNVFLDLDSIATRHLSVLASTGSGKSYTVGVILEESVKKGNRSASFVFDVHNEYHTLAEDEKYGDKFNLVSQPRISVKSLDAEDFNVAFPKEMSNVQFEKLKNNIDNLNVDSSNKKRIGTSKIKEYYSIQDIIDRLDENSRIDNNLIWRLRTMKDFTCLDKKKYTSVGKLFEPGKCNIIEFPKSAGKKERQLILWHMVKSILEKRKQYMKRDSKNSQNSITTPITIFVEEAHNFAPSEKNRSRESTPKTNNLMKEIAREGRKFGVGLCVISQRPSKLDEDVLSQCNSSIIMKVRNGVDQKTIARSVESAGKDLLDDLPGLTTGQAVLTGSFVQTPVLAKIRKRETEHGGVTPNVAEKNVREYKKHNKN